ncbi:MAG TPA: Holliday junction branch migration protein RuvA [Gammaproteobacteria bacterium]|jgi:Holliday junction DNA helicase RuvA|nr:Holliday junction branch migration protein RuvA [Gammaproteobacteria bacterium]HIB25925.1 Holliday junction branch migration protein RuvA [Gammaproteobacteria bacterium]
MIGSLNGLIISKKPSEVLLEVNGIGYEVYIPLSTSFKLPSVDQTVQLLTHLIVREDQHTLYGFITEDERKLFRALIKISGVGAKLALTILSGINVEGFIRSVQMQDVDTLVHLPGIGKKTAERLLVEMKDKVGQMGDIALNDAIESKDLRIIQEAHNALTSLGYKSVEARKILDGIDSNGLTVEALLKQALQSLNK